MATAVPVYPFALPALRYGYDALEPWFDGEGLERHHRVHHAEHLRALNLALADRPECHGRSIEQLLAGLHTAHRAVAEALRFHGGGHANHQFLWKVLGPPTRPPEGPLRAALNHRFGSLDKLRSRFFDTALAEPGDGWAFVVLDGHSGALEVLRLPANDSVLPLGKAGLLVCDLWEHARPRHVADRRAYLASYWACVDWPQVEARFGALLAHRRPP